MPQEKAICALTTCVLICKRRGEKVLIYINYHTAEESCSINGLKERKKLQTSHGGLREGDTDKNYIVIIRAELSICNDFFLNSHG